MRKSIRTEGVLVLAVVGMLINAGCGVEKTATETAAPPAAATAASNASPSAETLATKAGITMARIPAGEFVMGDDNGHEDEQPAHPVAITGFYMDVHEVTQESYQEIMGQNPAKHKDPKHPVEQVGWFGAIKYCNARSLLEGLTPCYNLETMECDFTANGYRLPTEAEWEYACRAGAATAFSFGDRENGLGAAAWFDGNSGQSTHPAGEKQPNPWGLFDMHGNVAEWCLDTYDAAFYTADRAQDPCNTAGGEEKVLRGGSWADDADACRSSARYSEAPGLADVCFGYDAYGFRCVRRVSAEP